MTSTLLLRLGVEKDHGKNRDVAIAVLNKVVEQSPFLTADNLEEYLPFSLVRTAYHNLYLVRSAKSGNIVDCAPKNQNFGRPTHISIRSPLLAKETPGNPWTHPTARGGIIVWNTVARFKGK
jgi:hypothetical protein